MLLQSEVEATAVFMRDMFEVHGGKAFAPAPEHDAVGASWHSPREALLAGDYFDDSCSLFSLCSGGGDSEGGTGTSGGSSDGGDDDGLSSSATVGSIESDATSRIHRAGSAASASSSGDTAMAAISPAAATAAVLQLKHSVGGGWRVDGFLPQSAVEELAARRGLRLTWHRRGWLRDNPLGTPTEREVYVASVVGGAVYRTLLVRR